jgi:signal transduction histidine kinase
MQTFETGHALVIPDTLTWSDLPLAATHSGLDIRSRVSMPMLHERQLIGILSVLVCGERRDFTDEEITFFRAIADQAAQTIANANLYGALRQEQSARMALLEKTISSQEDERKRIARELHDQTSQDLVAVMLSLDTCALALGTDESGVGRHLHTAKSIAETMLDNIHRLINDLRPTLLDDLGLAAAILWYGEHRLEPLGIALVFQCDRMNARIPSSLETSLFRITQEALTNVVRHAEATRVQVTLNVDSHSVHLTIQDNGVGFQTLASEPKRVVDHGLGLRGIQERVTALDGELKIESTSGRGTTIAVTVPLIQEARTDVQDPRAIDR